MLTVTRYALPCFAMDWRNPVRWTHYGDTHTGGALGFEVTFPSLDFVKYDGQRLIKEARGLIRNPLLILGMHVQLERGALDADDHAANELALQDGTRVFSAYAIGDTKFWCITDA